MKNLFVLAALLLCLSCATSVSTKFSESSYAALNDRDTVYVLEKTETLPANSLFIGDVKIGDSGFTTDCGYAKIMDDATATARKSGANIIKIVELKDPSPLGSTCYRLKAKLYRNFDTESLAAILESGKMKNKSRLPEGSDYALIHFYRPAMGIGALLGYKIKNGNDSIIGRLRNGEKFTYKTTRFGEQIFYAVLETKEEIRINVEKGEEYFVRGGMNTGIVIARPDLSITENHIGIKEFAKLKE